MFALVWKTAFIYFLILLTLRFMGKREVGQLGLFDFVVLLLIADVSAITLDDEKSIYTCLIPVIILSLIQKILAVILDIFLPPLTSLTTLLSLIWKKTL